jgi:hypothetical protein
MAASFRMATFFLYFTKRITAGEMAGEMAESLNISTKFAVLFLLTQ